MKKTTNKQYAIALYEATKELPEKELEVSLVRFVELLKKDHKIKKANKIITEFESYAKKQEGEVKIEITSAKKLDNETLEKLKAVFGKKVETKTNVDKTLIGGVKVATEDIILDASIKTQLLKLKQTFS